MLNRYAYLLLLASTLAIGNEPSASVNYKTVVVANQIRISVPNHWQFMDQNSRKNLAAFADALANNKESAHVASLAVNAVPAPTGAILRVSLVDADGLSQKDFIDVVMADPAGMNKELDVVGNEIVTTLGRQLAPTGIEIISRSNTAVEVIGGKLAMAIEYRRTALQDGATFNVTQYHIPLGAKKAIITLSFREQDAIIYATILSHVKSSIVIH